MRKTILVALIGLICSMSATSANAQMNMTMSNDTNVDATTTTHIATLAGDAQNYDVLTIQIVGTKVSGTVAGTAILYGSIDGTNYKAIGADTLTIANAATNFHVWEVDKTRYKYYKVAVATTGTQASMWAGKVFARKLPR